MRILLFALLIIFSSCAEQHRPSYRQSRHGPQLAAYEAVDIVDEKVHERRPWELWTYGKNLQGEQIRSEQILRADEVARSGGHKEAIDAYRAALKTPLQPQEKEALIFRIAGEELRMDLPDKALSTASGYFRGMKIGIEEVSPPFAVLFAYAFGRKGDFEQSLAWFSKVHEGESPDGALKEVASSGVRRILMTVADDAFEELAEVWKGSPFINDLVTRERGRRALSHAQASPGRPFQDLYDYGAQENLTSQPIVAGGPLPAVGVLLPLTGQYANLGISLKQGIELAAAGAENPAPPFIFKDTLGSAIEAVTQTRVLLSQEGTGMLVGPLLAEETTGVVDLLRGSQVPLLTFSKRGDLGVSDSVLRLAPTAEAQVQSLVEAASQKRAMRAAAIVYPDDAAGIEFADLFRRMASERGISIVYESSFPKDSIDALIQRAKEVELTKAEGIFFPDGLERASRFFSSLSETARRRMIPLGLANWDSEHELQHSATVMSGALFVSPFFRASTRPEIQQFITSYRERYGSLPDFLAAQGYDAASLIVAGMRRAISEGVTPIHALRSLDQYIGLTGGIRIGSSGEVERFFTVVGLEEGTFIEVLSPFNNVNQ